MKNNNERLIGKSAEDWTEGLWLELIEKVGEAKDKNSVRRLIEHLLSNDEKKMVAKRIGVMALLREGKSYKEISEILWLSPNTISTIKKNMLDSKENYKSYRKFYKGPRKYSGQIRIPKTFWGSLLGNVDLWDILMHPPRPSGIGILGSAGVPERPWSYRHKRKR